MKIEYLIVQILIGGNEKKCYVESSFDILSNT